MILLEIRSLMIVEHWSITKTIITQHVVRVDDQIGVEIVELTVVVVIVSMIVVEQQIAVERIPLHEEKM